MKGPVFHGPHFGKNHGMSKTDAEEVRLEGICPGHHLGNLAQNSPKYLFMDKKKISLKACSAVLS